MSAICRNTTEAGRRTLALLLTLSCLVACEGRPRQADPGEPTATVHEPHLAIIDLREGLPEVTFPSLFGGAPATSFSHLVLALRELADDERTKGVFVRLGSAAIGITRADEIGRLLEALRADGRPVVCHADGYQNGTMLLAARGCDEIWVSPAAIVETVGIAGQLLFGRELLDRLEVEVDYVQAGRFKGAEEPFTRTSSSPEARASLQNALGAVRSAWLEGIAEARGRSPEALGLEAGPHTAKRAKELGLIDAIGVERAARARALERSGAKGDTSRFGGTSRPEASLGELLRRLGGGQSAAMPHIAVVRASGAITVEKSGGLLSGPGGIAERTLTKKLRELEENDAAKAVVLRIDSPGGSALASDLLWHAIVDLKAKKPVIVSIGSLAASGGYYLACAGTKIVIEPTSILGSIGVVGGKLSFGKSLAEIGVNVETVPAVDGSSARAVYGSPLSGWDDATRAKMRETVEDHYDLFLERIASGRDLSVTEVAPHAEGRLMGGREAVAAKLADEVGGLSRALELAAELAAVAPSISIRIVDAEGGFLDLADLAGVPNASTSLQLEARALEQAGRASNELLLGPLRPYRREIEAFVASLEPLVSGESVIAALPFVLAVR